MMPPNIWHNNKQKHEEVADHSGKWGNQIEWLDKRQMPVKWPILQ